MKTLQSVAIRGLVVICATVLAVGSVLAAGKTFYVDAVHGNDAWTGTADWEHRDEATNPVTGPRKTLVSLYDDVTATSSMSAVGDTIYVAEGDYKEGSRTGSGNKEYRMMLKAGTRLVGTGDRTKTYVNGDGRMYCLNIGTYCLVKNVTICNGYAAEGSAWVGGGTAGKESFVVGCIVSNCVSTAAEKGGVTSSGSCAPSMRTLFVNNRAQDGSVLYSGRAWNCIFDQGDATCMACTSLKAYNCTFLNCSTANASGFLYNCLVRAQEGASAKMFATVTSGARSSRSTADDDCQLVQGLAMTQIDVAYMPIAGANVGIDEGINDNWTTNCWNAADYPLVADDWNLDFWGNPRVVNGTVDCGAVEYDATKSRARTLTITDAKGGITVSGAAPGVTVVASPDDDVVFSIARNYAPAESDPTKFCLGVNVNGEFISFTGIDADRVYEGSVVYGGTNLVIETVYATTNNWYVNPVEGRGDDTNDGYAPYRAKKTLQGAVENGLLRSGDVIHAAAGTYAEGLMSDNASYGTGSAHNNRVVVPEGVWLVADEGPEKTVIKGEMDNGGCGPNAARCVAMLKNKKAYVRGFTLTGGASNDTKSYAKYAGAAMANCGVFIDCIVTNNHALARVGGICVGFEDDENCGMTIGCYFRDNWHGTAVEDDQCVFGGWHFNAVFKNGTATSAKLVNCLLLQDAGAYKCAFTANSVGFTGANITSSSLYDCLIGGTVGGFTKLYGKTETNVEGLADMFDANFRPKAGTKPVDFGVSLSYATNCPAVFANLDFAGGQRIYNGTIDCGAGEFDWRGAYAKVLGGKQAAVEAASSNVIAADDLKSLALGAGAVLRMAVVTGVSGMCSFSPSGTVSVKLNGNVLAPIAGEYSFEVESGSPAALEISAVGSDVVTLTKFSLPKSGLMLLFR